MTEDTRKPGPATRAVHAGEARQAWADALVTPIAQTSTYIFKSTEELVRYREGEIHHAEYGRYENPTVRAVEAKLADLEGAGDALLTGNGMSAILVVVLAMLGRDGHVLLARDVYPGTRALFDQLLPKFGIRTTIFDPLDLETAATLVEPTTKLAILEAPSNPHLQVADLRAVAAFAKAHRMRSVVDATLASPALLRPLEYGIDLVLHSATKYLGGHHDLLAGCVAGAAPFVDALRQTRGLVGATLGPQDAWLLDRGLKTLPLRMARHSENGRLLAARLADDARVEAVFYPGLESDPGARARAATYLPNGAGGLVGLRPKGGMAATRRFVDALQLIRHAGSLGGVESLVQIPSLFSFHGASAETLAERGIEPDFIRLAFGIEDADDLWADLDRGLTAAAG